MKEKNQFILIYVQKTLINAILYHNLKITIKLGIEENIFSLYKGHLQNLEDILNPKRLQVFSLNLETFS